MDHCIPYHTTNSLPSERFAAILISSARGYVCFDHHIVANAKYNSLVLCGSQVSKEPLELGEVVNVDTMD
jgi:hypothetical protein